MLNSLSVATKVNLLQPELSGVDEVAVDALRMVQDNTQDGMPQPTSEGQQSGAGDADPGQSDASLQQDVNPAIPTSANTGSASIEDMFADIVKSIIQSQEIIIGPIAVMRAQNVDGLELDWPNKVVHVTGDPQVVIDSLVSQYQTLFGQISVQVCREAAQKYLSKIPENRIPAKLK